MSVTSLLKPRKGERRFDAAIREAVALKRELDKLSKRSFKLTPRRYLQEALDNAGVELDAVKRLRTELAERPSLRFAQRFVSAVKEVVRDVCNDPPRENLARQAPGGDLAMVVSDCLQIPSKPSALELVAVAVYELTEQEPECFGDCDDGLEATGQRIQEMRNRLDELCLEIPRLADQNDDMDVTLPEHNPNNPTVPGMVRVELHVDGVVVPYTTRCGFDLVNQLAARKA